MPSVNLSRVPERLDRHWSREGQTVAFGIGHRPRKILVVHCQNQVNVERGTQIFMQLNRQPANKHIPDQLVGWRLEQFGDFHNLALRTCLKQPGTDPKPRCAPTRVGGIVWCCLRRTIQGKMLSRVRSVSIFVTTRIGESAKNQHWRGLPGVR